MIGLHKKILLYQFCCIFPFLSQKKNHRLFPAVHNLYTIFLSTRYIYMRCESISSLPRELHASFWFYENRSLLYAHHDLLTDFKPNDPSSVFYFIWGIFFHTSFMYIHDGDGGGGGHGGDLITIKMLQVHVPFCQLILNP